MCDKQIGRRRLRRVRPDLHRRDLVMVAAVAEDCVNPEDLERNLKIVTLFEQMGRPSIAAQPSLTRRRTATCPAGNLR
jgi:hypothetical protein